MYIEVAINILFGVLIFAFAEQLAAFVTQNTTIEKVFRDAGNPMTYRVLGILVIAFGILNPIILNFVLQ